ncbi:S8 family peptidase [Flavobacterium sp.]|uniref:S8 family peptidase n=1 Tax=Flavobacterium sp. TaxID=239 RepID=UPI002633EF6B|nr:S8 family peptidase [Flavobacterium sp.]
MAENYKHIFISGNVKPEKYKASPKQGKQPRIPARDRTAHSAKLLQQFDTIWNQKKELEQARTAEKIATREGTYLSFTSAADHDLITKSLENIKKGIRLLNVKEEKVDGEHTQVKAIVYIPNGMEGFFISKIAKYEAEDLKSGKPKNAPLVNSINDVRIALLEGLWTDKLQLIPTENSKWCEAWLNVNTKDKQEKDQIGLFLKTLENIGIEYKRNTIIFPERAVLLINASRNQLIELMLQSDLLAEFRAGQEPAGFWINESAIEQQAWVDDLLQRIEQIDSNIKVCVLDSGVNNGHQLLQPLIDNANTLTVDNAWGANDHETGSGHGTLMAGIAGYGQMESILVSTKNVPITHRICSVKILPPPTQEATPKELWGDVTAQGIARAEIQNPEMILIYCMSVTSKQDAEQGRPSSWSGAIDNLAFGDGENQRLIIISAGNIRDEVSWKNYPDSNYVTTIENPAQSWNSVVIGAYTEKTQVNDENFKDYTLVANQGELSPYSSTSLVWEKKWPVKPDVVFEGGNLLKAPDESVTTHEDLELLSTSKRFNIKPFDTINATSAAAAQASWFAAKIAFEYPNAWPETVRALMVHSAFWNEAMLSQLNVKQGNRGDFKKLLKVFGFGKPELGRALYSQESALTFVAQEFIQPFGYNDKNQPETNEIHFFNLPWPKEILLEMGNIPVRLRVTLSYFIEPGAGEIGWKDKYRYQSHGLRFDINNVGEEEDEFRKRVNVEARDENEGVNSNSGSGRWVIGTNNRSNGSIHSDYWEGTAADLSTCNLIAVFPIIGWWRERKHLGKVENLTRYSLVISLETPAQEVELYTTVKNMIEVPIEIKTE